MRLGCAGPDEPLACGICGTEFLDRTGSHALCCDTANATRGHHAVSWLVFDAAKILDPSAELEAVGIIPGTRLRPADVLTTAVGSMQTALDIGITSPDNSHAGDDAAASYYEHKINKYLPHQAAFDAQNILYQPLIWTTYGRPHPRTTNILRTLARRIARRRGCADAEWR